MRQKDMDLYRLEPAQNIRNDDKGYFRYSDWKGRKG